MKNITVFAVLLAALLVGRAAPAWAGFDEGFAAFNRGDYAAALRGFKPLAINGDASARYNIAHIYRDGRGVPRDYAEAVKWYARSAAQGFAPARNNPGFMYDHGRGQYPVPLV